MLLREVAGLASAARHGRRGFVGATALVVACSPGEVGLFTPGSAEGGIERPGLRVEVGVDPADSTLAAALAWADGVPGAAVYVNRLGTLEWTVDTTDATGVADLRVLGG